MQAPDYVQAYWRENGFRMSGGGAVSWMLIDNMRALFVNGAEFGKILGWWFISGTTLHGFQGPLVFRTDRCCDEQDMIAGNNNAAESSMFFIFCKGQ
jgi:hypothetical protein